LASVGQSGPSTTPAVSGAGVVPDAPSSKVPGAVASDAQPAVPGLPYLGWLDLAIEDKARFFDRIAGLVSLLLPIQFYHRGRGSAPDGSSPRGCKQALTVCL